MIALNVLAKVGTSDTPSGDVFANGGLWDAWSLKSFAKSHLLAFGRNLARLREAAGLTQEKVAEQVDLGLEAEIPDLPSNVSLQFPFAGNREMQIRSAGEEYAGHLEEVRIILLPIQSADCTDYRRADWNAVLDP